MTADRILSLELEIEKLRRALAEAQAATVYAQRERDGIALLCREIEGLYLALRAGSPDGR